MTIPGVRGLACACLLLVAGPAAAQQPQPSRLALDTVVSLDETVDANGNRLTGVTLDAVASVDLGGGFEAIVRPIAQRFANSGEWNRQIWLATLRYQRAGGCDDTAAGDCRVGVRVDAGLIPSPVGMGNLMLRPHLNPTISLPASLFTALPAFELRGTRLTLLGAVYGLGASATVSGRHWDARAAAIDTSPLRTRRIFAVPNTNPPRFATVSVGGGVTPVVGVRVGASVTRTGWRRAGENAFVTVDRDATLVTVESEVSFRYTRLMGEWVRDVLSTAGTSQVASGWFVQGQQTLTPRWFVAARAERMRGPALVPLAVPGLVDQHLTGVEETVGYRLTPEITFRAGHRARRGFGRPGFDHQVAVSAVWWRRWI